MERVWLDLKANIHFDSFGLSSQLPFPIIYYALDSGCDTDSSSRTRSICFPSLCFHYSSPAFAGGSSPSYAVKSFAQRDSLDQLLANAMSLVSDGAFDARTVR